MHQNYINNNKFNWYFDDSNLIEHLSDYTAERFLYQWCGLFFFFLIHLDFPLYCYKIFPLLEVPDSEKQSTFF